MTDKIEAAYLPDDTAHEIRLRMQTGVRYAFRVPYEIRDELFELLQLGLHARERSVDAERQREVAKAIDELQVDEITPRSYAREERMDDRMMPQPPRDYAMAESLDQEDWLRMRARASARAAADHASGKVADTGRRGGTQDLFDQTIFDRVLGWFRR